MVAVGMDLRGFRTCDIVSFKASPAHQLTQKTPMMWVGLDDVVQRVESSKDLRAKIYARLTRENLNQDYSSSAESSDVSWMNKLV